ncbi:MAG: CotH kinase family protein [Cyclobacteriaceae bacterium]|nr:CotH kinase family protein [Cyclobacteriaceae bacterium]
MKTLSKLESNKVFHTIKKAIAAALLLLISAFSLLARNDIDRWEPGVYENSVWKYSPGISHPEIVWNSPNFNDDAWESGGGGIGFRDGDDRTAIDPALAPYLRNKFVVQNPNKVEQAQVHSQNSESSDLSAATSLSFGIADNMFTYGRMPSWFAKPLVFQSSNLPIVLINTNGQTIMDDTRIIADMKIIYNGAGNINMLSDPASHYSGKINIEKRGESSQFFPKKTYGFETQDALGNNLNAALLDMPAENDWVLYAPYSDKSMLRNALTYKIGNDMGNYAPRTKFVELILNDQYRGVYVLMEKIKRDKNRVNIAKLQPEDVTGDELTGGYIIRRDKIDANDYPQWKTASSPWNYKFQYYDPKGDQLVEAQRDYIRGFFNKVEISLRDETFKDENIGFRKYIDVPSVIDYMLVNEIGKNVDSYSFSTYMYKDKDSKGGKLHMGPLWDYNLAYGNIDYFEPSLITPGWRWDYSIYWFQRMLEDPLFSASMKCRWEKLRRTTLTNEYFTNAIDSMASMLDEAQQRNFEQWPILGVYVWPNQFVGDTYSDEISYLKEWILARLQWMDENMVGDCALITAVEGDPTGEVVSVYPNPSYDSFTISISQPAGKKVWIEIYSVRGEQILSVETTNQEFVWKGQNQLKLTAAAGVYIVKVFTENGILSCQRIIKL